MKIAEPNIRERTFEVTAEFAGWRLDRFLSTRLERLTRSKASRICRSGDLQVLPFRTIKPSLKLQKGDLVILREHLEPEEVQFDEIEILYEDRHLLILNKPAGMLVHEAAAIRQNTVEFWLKYFNYHGAHPVHRLDRETSGCLVCGKDGDTIAQMCRIFADNHPYKAYRARVLDPHRRWEVGCRDILDTPLGLLPATTTRSPLRMGRGSLEAKTKVAAIAEGSLPRFGRYVDLDVQIYTGRQHQIRVHLALEGTPIAGDKLYTYDDNFFVALCDTPNDTSLLSQLPYRRHALHAQEIGFHHPKTQKKMLQRCDWNIDSWPINPEGS